MGSYRRTHIRLLTMSDVNEFIKILNLSNDSFRLETADCEHKVDAKSLLGVMYMSAEHGEDIYLVNTSNKNGTHPSAICKFYC